MHKYIFTFNFILNYIRDFWTYTGKNLNLYKVEQIHMYFT